MISFDRPALLPIAVVAGVLLLAGALRAAPLLPGSPRELNTDRPDATESPFTVEAGRVQLEMDVASFTRNRLAGVRTVAPARLGRCGP